MARELSPESRLRRLRLAGLLSLAGLAVSLGAIGGWAAWASLSPRARYLVRPEQPVFGITVGSPVRVQGVVVGEVAAVRLWQSAPGGPFRPELALSIDLRRYPAARDLAAAVPEGLRVEFLPVNPASGFLEVDLVWRPGSPIARATGDPEELPTLPASPSAVSRVARFLLAVADGDPARAAAELGARLAAAEESLADSSGLASRAAESARGLRALAEELERGAGADALALSQSRLAEARERLRSAGPALDALAADLGEASRTLPASLAGLAATLRQFLGEAGPARPPEAPDGR